MGISKIVNKKKVATKTSQTEIKTIKKTNTEETNESTTTVENSTTTENTTTNNTTNNNTTTNNSSNTNNNTSNSNNKNNTSNTNGNSSLEVVEIANTGTNMGITIWVGLFVCTSTIVYINKQKRYE